MRKGYPSPTKRKHGDLIREPRLGGAFRFSGSEHLGLSSGPLWLHGGLELKAWSGLMRPVGTP